MQEYAINVNLPVLIALALLIVVVVLKLIFYQEQLVWIVL
jgi:hypothetical protein